MNILFALYSTIASNVTSLDSFSISTIQDTSQAMPSITTRILSGLAMVLLHLACSGLHMNLTVQFSSVRKLSLLGLTPIAIYT